VWVVGLALAGAGIAALAGTIERWEAAAVSADVRLWQEVHDPQPLAT